METKTKKCYTPRLNINPIISYRVLTLTMPAVLLSPLLLKRAKPQQAHLSH